MIVVVDSKLLQQLQPQHARTAIVALTSFDRLLYLILEWVMNLLILNVKTISIQAEKNLDGISNLEFEKVRMTG